MIKKAAEFINKNYNYIIISYIKLDYTDVTL